MQEDINNLQKNMIKMQTDISYIKKSLDENKIEHKEIMQKMEDWIKASRKEFAPKWVADAMKFIVGAIALAIVAKFMNLI